MSIAAVEEKIRELPEAYVVLVNDYVDSLLERAKKVQDLQGAFSSQSDVSLIENEKNIYDLLTFREQFSNVSVRISTKKCFMGRYVLKVLD